jgi:hypothetical protein
MTTAPTGEKPLTSNDRECDDLTFINGISPQRQQRLWKLGICTLQELAAISDDEIEAVAAEITGFSEKMIRKWRTKAQDRMSSQQVIEPPELESEDAPNSRSAESEWTSTDVFIVEFQVFEVEDRPEEQRLMAEHIEVRDGTWMDKFTGEGQEVKDEELWRWANRKVGDRMERMPELEEVVPVEVPADTAASPAASLPAKVEVTQILAFQPPWAETPIGTGGNGQPFAGFLRGGEPFALAASLECVQPSAPEASQNRLTYSAGFYARNLSTGERLGLGETEPITLGEGELPCTAMLPEVTLPPGMYRLRVLATSQGIPAVPGYLEVPVLQVV